MFQKQQQGLSSPRVKNVSLRAYFCLPYHVIAYIKLQHQLKKEQKRQKVSLFARECVKRLPRPKSVTTTTNQNYLKMTISSTVKSSKTRHKTKRTKSATRTKSPLARPQILTEANRDLQTLNYQQRRHSSGTTGFHHSESIYTLDEP
jgi:hypothetical protein